MIDLDEPWPASGRGTGHLLGGAAEPADDRGDVFPGEGSPQRVRALSSHTRLSSRSGKPAPTPAARCEDPQPGLRRLIRRVGRIRGTFRSATNSRLQEPERDHRGDDADDDQHDLNPRGSAEDRVPGEVVLERDDR